MKYFFMAVFLVFSRWVLDEPSAAEEIQTFRYKVEQSTCALTASESTTEKTLVGGGVGAVAGGILGRLVFGRKGTGVGAALGGATGAMVGHSNAAKAYHCKMLVNIKNKLTPFEATTPSEITRGYSYTFAVKDGVLLNIFP